ncbi:MAG TPA: erythromycin esterase family protein [Fluviicola sp.]|nr:erythromycin esterase family protein [Fluviicola sp.]
MKYLILCLLLVAVSFVNAQPLNLGFETPGVESAARPWGWEPVTWNDVTVTRDSSVFMEGQYSLKMESRTGTENEQFLRCNLEAYELRGKTITFTAKLKKVSEADEITIDAGYTLLDGEGGYKEFLEGSAMTNSTDWSTLEIELFIPISAQGVFLQLHYSGKDAAWFDDLHLMIGRKAITSLKAEKPFSRKELKWLADMAEVFYTTEYRMTDNDGESNDLLFQREVGSSSIVALGEATHGTAEFFTLKAQLLQSAVYEMGFRVFALEDNQLAVEEINNFVLTGKGSAAESMQGLFDVWYRKEMLDLVIWVRNYNEEHPSDPVYFVGFDMQEINRPVDKLNAWLQKNDTVLYKTYNAQLAGIKAYGAEIYMADDSVKLHWLTVSQQLVSILTEKEPQWLAGAISSEDSMNIRWGTQYARLIQQFCESSYKGYWAIYRDEAMADNIMWLHKVRFPGKKIIVWAHDVHISRGDHPNPLYNLNLSRSMGGFLSRHYGEDYKAYSLSTCEGSYSALKSYTDFEKISCPLFPGVERSLDLSLHKIAQKKKWHALFLPLSKELEWLAFPQPKRFANHVSIDYGYWERVSMPYQFDGVFFIDKTSPSTPF